MGNFRDMIGWIEDDSAYRRICKPLERTGTSHCHDRSGNNHVRFHSLPFLSYSDANLYNSYFQIFYDV